MGHVPREGEEIETHGYVFEARIADFAQIMAKNVLNQKIIVKFCATPHHVAASIVHRDDIAEGRLVFGIKARLSSTNCGSEGLPTLTSHRGSVNL